MQPTQPPAGPDPLYGFAGCYRHPDRLTGVRCVRCNRPICPECQQAASVGFQCPDDVRAGAATVRRGRTAVGAIVSSGPPYVTWTLIALNVIVYLVTGLGQGANLVNNTGTKLFSDWAMVPALVGYQHDYARLITSAFLHNGPLHILLNMWALYVLGPALERVLGWWRFLAVYTLSALGGSVAILVFGNLSQPVVGASGAIFGLFGAALVLSRIVGFDTRSLLITVGINLVFTFSVPGISKLGHIGGFAIGGLATLALLGWSLDRKPLTRKLQRIQAASLAGLLVLLVGAAVWRADEIRTQLSSPAVGAEAAPIGNRAVHATALSSGPSASSTVWTGLGRTTPV